MTVAQFQLQLLPLHYIVPSLQQSTLFLSNNFSYPCVLPLVGHGKLPAHIHHDGEWKEGLINMKATGHEFRWDPSTAIKPPKKKRVSKKEKGEKAEKVPSGKKRGRKPKTDKLGSADRLADTGGAGVAPDGASLEWTGFTHPNRVDGGAKQVSAIEEGNSGLSRASSSKSPHETTPLPAFGEEVRVLENVSFLWHLVVVLLEGQFCRNFPKFLCKQC